VPRLAILDDQEEVERWLRRDPYLHLYGLGDLDARFRPRTIWYGRREADALQSAVLLYHGVAPPALLALDETSAGATRALLRELIPALPPHLQCHLSPGLTDVLAGRYRLSAAQPHLKMGLLHRQALQDAPNMATTRLTEMDGADLLDLYRRAYPDNAYDPDLLVTGCFRGIRRDGRLVSAAGVHVYSRSYRVAALGSIATHPLHRGRGLARAVTAALCRDLLHTVDHIGLNVRADNGAAIACYHSLGFDTTHHYVELLADDAYACPAGPN